MTVANPLRVLIVGLGNMGRSHALAYHADPRTTVVGLVNRSAPDLPAVLSGYPLLDTFAAGLETNPDLVVISTYTDTHAEYAITAMDHGAHVFVEKPMAATAADAQRMVDTAVRTNRKLGVGYILRQHPGWQRLIQESLTLGGPFVFRFNLNQQSSGATWDTHRALMETTSPLVDCGVHYVDVMCQITDARPVRVSGIGLRLSDELAVDMYNYGQLQVTFDDGSVGWYEAGWGPMMSETASFVKDVVSPNGSVSIVDADRTGSDDVDGHTSVGGLLLHRPGCDTRIDLPDEPDHQTLCDAEATWMIDAIIQDKDLSRHAADALNSLRICLAADESIRSGQTIALKGLS